MSGTEIEISDLHAEAVRALPFVSETPQGEQRFWTVEETGHLETDVELGAYYGRLAIEASRRFDVPELVAFVMRDMILAGKFTALEVGFLSQVASAAKAGSLN